MKKRLFDDLFLWFWVSTIVGAAFWASSCAQADPDQYAATGTHPVYGESNGWFYDKTNDRMSCFVNDVEVAYVDNTGSIVQDSSMTVGIAAADTDYTLTFDGETADCVMTCMEDETRLDVEANLQFGTGAAGVDYTFTADGETADGTWTWMEDEGDWKCSNDLDMVGDIFAGGGAGALTFDSGSDTINVPDNDATALGIGLNEAAGSLLVLDTTDSNEEVNIVGTTATSAFRVDTGFATFDEQAVLSAGASVTGDVSINGAAGSLTFPDGDETIVIKDNDADSFGIGLNEAAGALMLFDTTDSNEEVNIVGTTATSAFRVDTGFATFDEQVVCTAGADINDDVFLAGGVGALTFDAASSSIVTTDNTAAGLSIGAAGDTDILVVDTEDAGPGVTINGTLNVLDAGSAGWADGASGNQACNTTCAGTGACLFGFDAGTTALVDCEDATADSCICGGPSS